MKHHSFNILKVYEFTDMPQLALDTPTFLLGPISFWGTEHAPFVKQFPINGQEKNDQTHFEFKL